MTITIRPTVNVYGLTKTVEENVPMPDVFKVPIRADLVQDTYKNVSKNSRQARGVSTKAGEQTSAESWGTGRALARIPRVKGGGTMRSGQGAFGNMCRGGRMYAPLKVWRKWTKQTNKNMRRFATCSSLAATGITGLVMAKGHRVEQVPELPLVLSDKVQETKKTKEAVQILKTMGLYEDVERVINSKTIRPGKGKMRNRKYIQRKGPLIIYKEDNGITKAFRNIPGVELVHVNYLDVLKLAPGATLGRLVVWTKSAFVYLNTLFGTYGTTSSVKIGYHLPAHSMENPDIKRILSSEEIQKQVVAKPVNYHNFYQKKQDPFADAELMKQLNPFDDELKKILSKFEELNEKRQQETREAYELKHFQLLKND